MEPYQKVGARYYDATFGRFITRDTLLNQLPYAYCYGDPVNFTDPSGHKTKPKPKPGPTSGGGAPSSGGSGSSAPSGGGGNAEANKGMVHAIVDTFVGGAVGLATTAAFAPLMTPLGSGMMGVAAGADAAGLADYYLTKAGY